MSSFNRLMKELYPFEVTCRPELTRSEIVRIVSHESDIIDYDIYKTAEGKFVVRVGNQDDYVFAQLSL